MRLRNCILTGIILLTMAFTAGTVLADTNNTAEEANVTDNVTEATASAYTVLVDDIEEDDALIGPGNALYGLKIAFENLGTTFTFDPNEKLGKQIAQARQRIAEGKAQLKKNNFKGAEIAFEKYKEEMDEADETIAKISDETGLLKAQLMIAKHQYVLERLLDQSPDNKGLQRAYNNSLRLEEKFKAKTQRKFVRLMSREGREVLKEEYEESEDYDERTQIKAELTDIGSNVKIKVRFMTNSTNETEIASETLNELQKLRNNAGDLLKIELDDNEGTVDVTGSSTSTMTASSEEISEKDRIKLKVEAEVEGRSTKVDVEYEFYLDAKDRDSIIKGIDQKLSELDSDTILGVLDLKVRKEIGIEKSIRDEKREKKMDLNGRKGDSSRED